MSQSHYPRDQVCAKTLSTRLLIFRWTSDRSSGNHCHTMAKKILSPESVKRFREERGLSQQALATLLNVGTKTVSRWERGQTEPTGTTAAILSVLISGMSRYEEMEPLGPLASGYAIYQILKRQFEGEEPGNI